MCDSVVYFVLWQICMPKYDFSSSVFIAYRKVVIMISFIIRVKHMVKWLWNGVGPMKVICMHNKEELFALIFFDPSYCCFYPLLCCASLFICNFCQCSFYLVPYLPRQCIVFVKAFFRPV